MSGIVEPESSVTGLERKLELLVDTGLQLAGLVDTESIVDAALHAGLQISGAQTGSFLILPNAWKEGSSLYAIREGSRVVRVHEPARVDTGDATERVADISTGPEARAALSFLGWQTGARPIRSFLSVPVRTELGGMLGRLFYGHENVGVFTGDSERLVGTIAAQSAIAIQSVTLARQNKDQMAELQDTKLRLEEAVKRLSELAAIVEFSDDAILSKDLTGRIRTWNASAARIFGYREEEIVGKSILQIIPEELHHEEPVILSKIRAGEKIDHYETVRVTKKGERLHVSLSISPVRDSSGKIVGASKILRDVSQRKRIEASLIEAEKISATGRMAATIAHEINNPLEAVVNLLYLAKSASSLEEAVGYVMSAEGEVARVSHIARQTLGFYRDNASAVSTNVAELVGSALKIYAPRCNSLGISLETRLTAQRSIVMRKGEILQVLSNLIANAIQFMGEGGRLTISVEDRNAPDGIVIRVADTGIGIPESELPHIFEAFFTTRGPVGTGIGLFVASQLVTAHGGTIEVDTMTEPDKHGTTMSVFLPSNNPYTPAVH